MKVDDALVPIWHQGISNIHADNGQSAAAGFWFQESLQNLVTPHNGQNIQGRC